MSEQGTWTLAGITAGRGSCEHCGRTLARLFKVVSPTGTEMVVGRVCSAKMTGYKWSVALAERIEAIRVATEAAMAKYPELWESLSKQAKLEGERYGVTGSAGEGRQALWQGIRYRTEAEVLAYAEEMLAHSIAREGVAA